MSAVDIQHSTSGKLIAINNLVVPKPVFNLLIKHERLLAIKKYKDLKKVSLDAAVNKINSIYNLLTEDVV